MVKDWINDAAEDLNLLFGQIGKRSDIRAVIAKHCPFESGVAYMPVPRCDQCLHWQRHNYAATRPLGPFGRCNAETALAGVYSTREDFGCVRWEEK